MKSMTGFGEGKRRLRHATLTVTLQSVNSKRGLDIHVVLPKFLSPKEQAIREACAGYVSRGRVSISVAFEVDHPAQRGQGVRVDRERLRAYRAEMDKVIAEFPEASPPSVDFLCSLPGVLRDGVTVESDLSERLLDEALAEALKRFDASREREGRALKKDFEQLVRLMEAAHLAVTRRAPSVVIHYRESLAKRMESLGFHELADDSRFLKEVALFADRCDISEELQRLKAHFKEVRRLIRLKEPQGKSLDFLSQEIGREINTIGSKANDLEISRQVLTMKAHLEQFREQISNTE